MYFLKVTIEDKEQEKHNLRSTFGKRKENKTTHGKRKKRIEIGDNILCGLGTPIFQFLFPMRCHIDSGPDRNGCNRCSQVYANLLSGYDSVSQILGGVKTRHGILKLWF